MKFSKVLMAATALILLAPAANAAGVFDSFYVEQLYVNADFTTSIRANFDSEDQLNGVLCEAETLTYGYFDGTYKLRVIDSVSESGKPYGRMVFINAVGVDFKSSETNTDTTAWVRSAGSGGFKASLTTVDQNNSVAMFFNFDKGNLQKKLKAALAKDSTKIAIDGFESKNLEESVVRDMMASIEDCDANVKSNLKALLEKNGLR
jgi:hypothetical protein